MNLHLPNKNSKLHGANTKYTKTIPMKKNCLILLIPLFISLSCRQKAETKQSNVITIAESKAQTDIIHPDQILMHAELRYDSTSYIVLENHSPLPITYDAVYRFEQKTYGSWKTVKVRQKDTTCITLPPGSIDTLRMEIAKDIDYQPLGTCRIYKTIRTAHSNQQFELMCETDARAHTIDWNKVELIPDKTQINTTFVTMTAGIEGKKVTVTIHNKTDREITFGDGTNFSLSVFMEGKWYSIVYPQLENSIAVILPPNGIIENMMHNLTYINYKFKSGKYRITKKFFFGSDYKHKYVAGSEFSIE